MKNTRTFLVRMVCAGCLLVPMTIWAAPGASPVQTQSGSLTQGQNTPRTPAEILADMASTIHERDDALHDWQARFQNASSDQRTAMETEGTSIAERYLRQYLTLMIDYDRATGNMVGVERTSRSLAELNGGNTPTQVVSAKLTQHTPPVADKKTAQTSQKSSKAQKTQATKVLNSK